MTAHELPPLTEVLAAVVAAVEAEGARLLAEFHLPGGPRGAGSKAPIDVEIELRLRAALQRALPCSFIGEETGETPCEDPGAIDGWAWIVDPHDATSDFLKGIRGSSISVGLLRGSVPVLGVVHAPASPDRGRETFAWAEGAGPLRRNGRPVHCDLRGGTLAHGAIVIRHRRLGPAPGEFLARRRAGALTWRSRALRTAWRAWRPATASPPCRSTR